ncbi:bifunctional metallophosphatase/5'-nucleotidase [Atopococcus tabaci]|uniref:bifunctional metallophosphatase/5'-nucleotidase n=1 Tax=Atopococcus tabaci TaxID=269774 RepID=UPI0024092986|nr:5'-nucleotidase C-terminal domain-containing protein [Atopococcus tabaci]
METIHIFHTNDIHSHLENWPRVAHELRNQRVEKEEEGDTVFSFDIGDATDRAHPLTEATNGQAITRLLNDGLYDAVTIGNNEGIGSTKEELNRLYDDSHYDVLIANLKDKDTGLQPHWAKTFSIYRTKEGQRLGVFGLTHPFPVSYGPLGWEVEDPFDTIQHLIDLFSEGVDTFVLLSHLGIHYDREIAGRFPEISVILGAHTHHLLPEGERIGRTLLAGAGRYGEYIGQVELQMEGGAVLSSKASVKNVQEQLPPVRHEMDLVRQYQQLGYQLLMQQEIAHLPEMLDVKWDQPSELVDVGLKAFKDYAGTEASVLNAGLFLQPLLEGVVTRSDLHRSLPHPMRLVKVTMNGRDLRELLLDMEVQRPILKNRGIKGSGFRGQIFGEICYNGINFGEETGEPLWKGEPLKENADYTFTTVDFFLFAPFFPLIEERGRNEVLFPYFIRHIMGDYLKKQYPLIEGRKK